RCATATWRAGASGTPRSSSAGGRTVRRTRARSTSWTARGRSTSTGYCPASRSRQDSRDRRQSTVRTRATGPPPAIDLTRAGMDEAAAGRPGDAVGPAGRDAAAEVDRAAGVLQRPAVVGGVRDRGDPARAHPRRAGPARADLV